MLFGIRCYGIKKTKQKPSLVYILRVKIHSFHNPPFADVKTFINAPHIKDNKELLFIRGAQGP